MYIPQPFREDDTAKLVEFMQAHSFATLVTVVKGFPVASHVPLVTTQQNGSVTLSGHLAKANPQWQAFNGDESLAIFTGPHAYISPTLYENQESVPTWNYIAVHAYGVPKIITLADAPEAMDEMIESMVAVYEPSYKSQWEELSDRFRNDLMNAIVGFEMQVTKLEGKYKLSQNRSHFDRANIANTLSQCNDPTIADVGELMKKDLSDEI
jgi:transcriptional regulator